MSGEHIVKRKGNNVIIKAAEHSGYVAGVDKLCKVTDNGNGYTVKFYGNGAVHPDIFMSLDYNQAELLLLALQEFDSVHTEG